MRRLFNTFRRTLKQTSLRRGLLGACVVGGVGSVIGLSVCSTPNPYQKVVSFDPIHHNSSELQVSLKTRENHLAEMQNTSEYDLIIVGGGCNGAGVFLEAAARGLKCLLVESEDFAAATSSKSTKLIHGGVRYLQDVFEFSLAGGRLEKYELVKEALRERTHFLENAFYMNRQLPFVLPVDNIFVGAYYYVGCLVYHFIYLANLDKDKSSFRFKLPQWYGSNQLREYFPYLDDKYKYGIVYYDGQFNDSRMNLDILLTATQPSYQGCQHFTSGNILNYARVDAIIKQPSTTTNSDDSKVQQISGVILTDKLSGKKYTVKSRCVVNCAGAFGDDLRRMDDPECAQRILSVSGSHLTMPQRFSSRKHALVIPKTQDGRILFLVPWLHHTVVGTTEQYLPEPILNPTVSSEEMIFMGTELSKLFPKVPVTQITNNIESKWAGIRPLILDNQVPGQPVDTKKVARKHVIEVSKSGLVSLLGGKWTVYRRMGEETVNEIFKLFKSRGIKVDEIGERNSTLQLRLLGEANKNTDYKFPPKSTYVKIYANALVDKYEIDIKLAKNLIKTYGMRGFDVLQMASKEKNFSELKERIHPDHPFLKAEVLYHIRYEMAQYPIDVLLRRMRMAFLDRKGMFESLKVVCDIFAKEGHWDDSMKQKVFQEQNEILRKMDF